MHYMYNTKIADSMIIIQYMENHNQIFLKNYLNPYFTGFLLFNFIMDASRGYAVCTVINLIHQQKDLFGRVWIGRSHLPLQ